MPWASRSEHTDLHVMRGKESGHAAMGERVGDCGLFQVSFDLVRTPENSGRATEQVVANPCAATAYSNRSGTLLKWSHDLLTPTAGARVRWVSK